MALRLRYLYLYVEQRSRTVGYVVSGEASRSLVIIPNDDSFSKAIGDSIVLTCKVVRSDGQRPPAGSSLRWLDDNDQEIVDVNGRFDSTSISVMYLTTVALGMLERCLVSRLT